jgi:hypothetical protein
LTKIILELDNDPTILRISITSLNSFREGNIDYRLCSQAHVVNHLSRTLILVEEPLKEALE